MTVENMNEALYEKMKAEQNDFRKFLLSLPPEEILNHAYEYTIREDILSIVENSDSLSEKEVKGLLSSRCPITDVYRRFNKYDYNVMDNIRNCIREEGEFLCDRTRDTKGRDSR